MARPEHPIAGAGAAAAFAERLRSIRDQAGLTYRELAAEAGYSPATLSIAASGHAVPTWEVASAFARACGADPEHLRGAWSLAKKQQIGAGAEIACQVTDGLDQPDPASMVEFRVLGPLSISCGSSEVEALGTLKEQALLAILLLNANRLVSTAQIAQSLWGDAAPVKTREIMQAYGSRLRRRLREATGDSVMLEFRSGRYRIVLDDEQLDLARFERLVSEARTARENGSFGRAVDLFCRALDEWSGEPLENLGWSNVLVGEQGALQEKRRAVQIERIEAQLILDRYQDATISCRQLLGRSPLDQQLIGLLMRALAGAGRHDEALDAYRGARARLRDQLGLDTNRHLRQIHQAVLRGELDQPAVDDVIAS